MSNESIVELVCESARVKFRAWLLDSTIVAGRGDTLEQSTISPANQFWLGRLLPEDAVIAAGADERGERLEPCAIGIQFRAKTAKQQKFTVVVSMCTWIINDEAVWQKTRIADIEIPISMDVASQNAQYGEAKLSSALRNATGCQRFGARIDVESSHIQEHTEFTVTLVNCGLLSDKENKIDTRVYECRVAIKDIAFIPFVLEALPESYRYERYVPAYGVNSGIVVEGNTIRTEDVVAVDTFRPRYWGSEATPPDLSFQYLVDGVIDSGMALVAALEDWGNLNWKLEVLDSRAMNESWSEEMRQQSHTDAKKFDTENQRITDGLSLLRSNALLSRAFSCMHKAMTIVGKQRGYSGWRPFQFGFLLANLASVVAQKGDADIVDVVWFATGGGKTETYMGLLLTAAFYDRLSGKLSGATAWSRFPLRMLSLQQTQRFADALAAAEMVRRNEMIAGDPMSLGFFIGSGATPNRIYVEADGDRPCANDPLMPDRYKVLDYCPFCGSIKLKRKFNREIWRLELHCESPQCSWPDGALPVYIVDEEIYRFLPTVLVGTLDKAALIGMQQAMRGLVGAPWGLCSTPGHGFTYAPRDGKKNGCLVPECRAAIKKLPMDAGQFAPRFRLQDELHLLRDSLGAVDSHYESLYDDLTVGLGAARPKILASSATLRGYEKQVNELYQRRARLFPAPGPQSGVGFWSAQSDEPMRQFVGIAPRGLTLEWVNDSIVRVLQKCIRDLVENTNAVCGQLGIAPSFAPQLIDEYGTQVVYGNSLRDIEAVYRSGDMQPNISGHPVNWENLTGKTNFADVTNTLKRLQAPEADYYERIHAITASSMMSHGVDVDRLNAMIMLGLPLGAAEFIQATARVGRKFPGLVFVVHKISRERDAMVYRMFREFVLQAERFVEPVPISRRSRRVLDRTIAGIALARILMIHEPDSGKALTTIYKLREWSIDKKMDWSKECEEVIHILGFDSALDEGLRKDLRDWYTEFGERVQQPPSGAKWISDASCTEGPMTSLRDVDKQIQVLGSRVE